MNEEKIFYNYIWFIKNTDEVFYVGKGKGNRCHNIAHRNKFFLDMYNTHECDVKIVKDNLTEQEAFDNEKRLIKWYRENTNYRLTNQTDGGEGISGFVPTQEMKNKISQSSKNKWKDEEFRNKEIKIRNDPNGVYQSKEFKEKISQLVSGTKNPNYLNHWSDEQKQRLSELRKKNGKSAGTNNAKATKIICIETGEVFDLIKDAMKKYNIKSEGSVTVALKDKVRTAGGKHWSLYKEELLDANYRFKYYLSILNESRFNSYICLETKEIFVKQVELNKATINKRNEAFNSLKDKNGTIIYDDKTYMLVSYYVTSPFYQE